MSDTLRVSNVYAGTAIGIGKTPAYALDVVGSINLTGSILVGGSTFSTSQWTTTGSNIYYNTGSIGIGTNAPSAALDIGGSFRVLSQTYTALTSGTGIDIIYSGGGTLSSGTRGAGGVLTASTMSYAASTHTFYTGTNASTSAMTIASAGYVGIGATNPMYKMQIILASNSDPGLANTFSLSTGDSTAFSQRLYMGLVDNGGTGSNSYSWISASRYGYAFNSIALNPSGGNVGIGKTNPGYALDVLGSVNVTGSFYVNGVAFSGSSQWTTSSSDIYYTTGKVGIGKTNPRAALDIVGSVNYPNGSDATQVYISDSTGTGLMNLLLGTNGTTNYASIQSSLSGTGPKALALNPAGGNVGIGMTNPNYLLSIPTGVTTNLFNFLNTSGTGYGFYCQSSNVASRGNTMDWYASDYNFGTITTRPVFTMRPEGYIGIGTTAPTYPLTVKTSGVGSAGIVHTDGTIIVGSYVGGSISAGWYGTTSNHPLCLFTNNAAAQVTLATSGYLGVGITNPTGMVHAHAGQWPYGCFVASTTSNPSQQLVIGTYWTGTASTSYSALQSVTQNVANNNLALNPYGGNVGIGLTNPSALLHVNGAAIITGSLSVNGSAVPVSSGSVWATGSAGSISYGSGVVNITAGSKIGIQNNADGGTANGIYYWNTGDANWVGYMGQSGAGKSASGGTACTGAFGFTAHALRNRVTNASTQGFIWENLAETCLMSIRGDGAGGGVIGSWGVGTISPNASVHIYNTSGDRTTSLNVETMRAGIQLKSTGASGGNFNIWSSLTGETPGAGALCFYDNTNTAFRMVINSSGYVGIGTAVPGTPLDIQGIIQIGSGGGNSYDGITFTRGTTSNSYPFIRCQTNYIGMYVSNASGWAADSAVGDMVLRTYANAIRFNTINGTTSSVVITGTGTVGIGTTTPNYVLSVSGTSGTGILEVNRTGASTNYGVPIVHTLTSATGSFRGEYARVFGGTNGTIATSAQSQANGYYCIDIANAGVFQSDTNAANSAFYMTNSQAAFNVPINIGAATAGQGPFSIKTTNASYVSQYIQHYVNSNWPIWIQFGNSGYTASCNFMLFQDATSNVRGSIASSSQSTIAYNVGSDARIKHNIQDLTNIRSMIERFRPRSFELNNDPNNIEHHGFIAQEVLAEFPHLVTLETAESNIMMLDYGKFSPYGIAGVQDLYKVTDALYKENTALRAQVSTLQSQLDAIMARLAVAGI